MSRITVHNGRIIFFGNPAGYIKRDTAIVDAMFQTDEFERWLQKEGLTPNWQAGVMDCLLTGAQRDDGSVSPLKSVRIWQLRPGTPIRMRFISYKQMVQEFGEPTQEQYRISFDGQTGTNDLEELWNHFSCHSVDGKGGAPLAISDIVELYDESGSAFFYVDRSNFRAIEFTATAQTEEMGQCMTPLY